MSTYSVLAGCTTFSLTMGCCSQKLWIICLSASGVVLLVLGLAFGVCEVFDKLINENVDKVSIYKKCFEKI